MNCPHCNVPLVMTERQGVEIDYCPQCRGVWLDRGELDKIIERQSAFEERIAAAAAPAPAPSPQQQQPPPPPQYGAPPPQYGAPPPRRRDDDDDDDDERHFPVDRGARSERDHRHDRYGTGRRRGFLGELFDFD